jgi:hypothetical protein
MERIMKSGRPLGVTSSPYDSLTRTGIDVRDEFRRKILLFQNGGIDLNNKNRTSTRESVLLP